MDVVGFIDLVYQTRDVSACLIILEDESYANKVRTICEAKLYPVFTERFMLHTWTSFISECPNVQSFDLIIMSRNIPYDKIMPLIRMQSVTFIL